MKALKVSSLALRLSYYPGKAKKKKCDIRKNRKKKKKRKGYERTITVVMPQKQKVRKKMKLVSRKDSRPQIGIDVVQKV